MNETGEPGVVSNRLREHRGADAVDPQAVDAHSPEKSSIRRRPRQGTRAKRFGINLEGIRDNTSMQTSTRPFWICAIMAASSAVVSASFSLAALIGEGGHDVYAMYAASRSVSLPLVVFTCMLLRSRHGIAAMALTMTLVQGFDAGIGFLTQEPGKTYGPLILAVITFASLAALLRSPGVQTDV
jgi:hypothetical protein